LFLVLAAFLAAFATVMLWPPDEPSYKGRILSAWVADLGVSSAADPNGKAIAPETIARATNAVFQIGTNACPYLLKCVRYRRPEWKQTLFPIANGFLSKLPTRFRFWDEEELQAYNAAAAFRYIPAVDDGVLEQLNKLRQDIDSARRERAMMAINGQARVSLPALILVFSNASSVPQRSQFQDWSNFKAGQVAFSSTPTQTRISAIGNVWKFRTNAVLAIPALLACLQETNGQIVSSAAGMLHRLEVEPRPVVAALTNALQSPHSSVRSAAVYSLQKFERDALPSLGALYDMRNDPDYRVRRQATNAVSEIEPYVKHTREKP